MKGANQVLPMARIDPRLAADAGVDLREKRGRNLDQSHAPSQSRSAKPREVADYAAAERNDDVSTFDSRLDQRVGNASEFSIALRGLAGRANDRSRAQARLTQAFGQPLKIERGDAGVGHHGAIDARSDLRDLDSSLVD